MIVGYFINIVRKLQLEDTERFQETIRMDFKHFNKVLNLIVPDITPQEIICGNKVISAAERLTATLRFLATGETFQSLSFQFRISYRATSYIVKEVCNAIVKYLFPPYPKVRGKVKRRGMVINCCNIRKSLAIPKRDWGYRRKTSDHSKAITWSFALL